MSRGFTLIELLVTITIMGVLAGGGVLYLTRSNSVQKIDTAKQELLSNLRYARVLATTNQIPPGFSGQLNRVAVNLGTNGFMSVWPNAVGVGPSYFSKDLTQDGINLSMSSGGIAFTVYEGRFVGVGSTMVITISSNDLTADNDKKLIITQSGLINDQ